MVLSNTVNENIDLILANKELIVMVITFLTLVVNVFYNVLKGKKSFQNIGEVSRTTKAVGKVVGDFVGEAIDKIDDLIVVVKKLVKENKDKNAEIENLNKLTTLLIQSANIPIKLKKDYLEALNSKGDKGVELAQKSLKGSIETVERDIKEQDSDLDNKVKNLENLE